MENSLWPHSRAVRLWQQGRVKEGMGWGENLKEKLWSGPEVRVRT